MKFPPGFSNPIMSNPALQYAEIAVNTEIHIPRIPYLGTNLIAKMSVPKASQAVVQINIVLINFGVSITLPFVCSLAICISLRPSFFLKIIVKPVVKDIIPSPPSCIKSIITS